MSFFKVFFLFLFLNIILFFYFFFFNDYIYLFIFWLCWVFVSVRGLSLVVARGLQSVWALVCSVQALLLRRVSSVVVAGGLSCPAACGILVP